MSKPDCPQKSPYTADLEPNTSYWWCACGKAKTQPFCDGSHSTTDFKPLEFSVTEKKSYYLCGCKQTKTPPYCDGSHNNLSD